MTSRLQAKLLAQRALFQRLQSSKKRNKLQQSGFTLVELLIVVVIIGILSAIAIPSFVGQRNRAYAASATTWAASEARKCAAALLISSGAPDFEAADKPDDLGDVVATGGACSADAEWTVKIGDITETWTAKDDGTVEKESDE